jgi:hypothetical protein
LRACPCPRLRRLVVLRGPREVRAAYTCIRCLFARPVARSTAELAVTRSPILLESLPCLAAITKVHLRVVRREGDPDVF